ncbi:hypothetical protein AZE42_05045 [Rhizopogon vesiculosus]|uniref:Methyltransferase type 11 domain-containing protein n=1 Tax=Rhizopogon vesiculosus TaxID=180088 RepID=A0A1J8Q414_9AGAM|nr:hypothetical protein AZE42_05045 [Rhizopogon vesiculosus]
MRIAGIFGLFPMMGLAIRAAFWPIILAVWHAPSLLFRPQALSTLVTTHVWRVCGSWVDEHSRDTKKALITPHAHGIVLEIGPSYGHTIQYLDHSRVTKYVAVEPNVLMHPELRRVASAAGYSEDAGTLLILSCGAEDISAILSSLPAPHPPIDTLISIFTLCSIPAPQLTTSALITEALKPGGQVLLFEHMRSDMEDVAWWQRFWTPMWGLLFDGCELNRPTHRWIEDVGGWAEGKWSILGKEGEPEELINYRVGRFVRAE